MIQRIDDARRAGDSLGGSVTCVAHGVPPGLGEPVFDKLEAELAAALLSLPACKGFEIGSGFAGTRLLGSEHNDAFVVEDGRVHTRTNRSGGVQGGISNGEPILVRAAFKPTATIRKEQDTVNRDGEAVKLEAQGRHDPCVLPRAVPMVEAMVALVLCDHLLLPARDQLLGPSPSQEPAEPRRSRGVLFDLLAVAILAVFVLLGALRGTLAGFLRVATVGLAYVSAFLAATHFGRAVAALTGFSHLGAAALTRLGDLRLRVPGRERSPRRS